VGTDIRSFAEVRGDDGTWSLVGDVFPRDDSDDGDGVPRKSPEPFDWRDYGLFGWLADVRNYSAIKPIHAAKGVPEDLSPELDDPTDNHNYYGHSWLTLAELQVPDYEAEINDRRIEPGADHEETGPPEAGEKMTLREFLGARYFQHLDMLATLGRPTDVRIVFWFH
jgi:hypothetical protein